MIGCSQLFDKRKSLAQKNCQVFLGIEDFVTELQTKLAVGKDLSEIPRLQRRKNLPISVYEKHRKDRNEAIERAYRSGGYSMKELDEDFYLHYSRGSRIIKHAEVKDSACLPCLVGFETWAINMARLLAKEMFCALV